MKSLLTALLLALATFVYVGGEFKLKKPSVSLIRKFPTWSFKKSNLDQEFLNYLWELKSELSSGSFHGLNDVQIPNHKNAEYVETILRTARQTGAPLTPTLNRIIKQTKNSIQMNQEIKAELASTKATLVVLAALPFLGFFIGSLMSSHSLHWLISTKFGHLALTSSLLLDFLGIYWLKKIINRALAVR